MTGDICLAEEEFDAVAGVKFVMGASPDVQLVSITSNPRKTLAAVVRGYTGVHSPIIGIEEQMTMMRELAATKLQTPLAFVNMVWLFHGMTRAWCNQLERYRVATSFVQQTLRFNYNEKQLVKVLIPRRLLQPTQALALEAYRVGARESVRAYHKAIEAGAAQEDARGLLPLNTLSSVFFGCNLQTLAHIYSQRMCCQAQSEEWTPVMQLMKAAVHQESRELAKFMLAPWEGGAVSCGFGASFDRPCTNHEFFDTNLEKVVSARYIGTIVGHYDGSEPVGVSE